MTMKYNLYTLLAVMALASTPAFADSGKTSRLMVVDDYGARVASIGVALGDLDLSVEEHQQQARKRIFKAARIVCKAEGSTDFAALVCAKKARSKAFKKLSVKIAQASERVRLARD
jgi:UrcA family protein